MMNKIKYWLVTIFLTWPWLLPVIFIFLPLVLLSRIFIVIGSFFDDLADVVGRHIPPRGIMALRRKYWEKMKNDKE